MGQVTVDEDVQGLVHCVDELDVARLLAIPVERVRAAVVQVLFEACTVPEALAAGAACAAVGDVDGARGIVDAVLEATGRAARRALRPLGGPALA